MELRRLLPLTAVCWISATQISLADTIDSFTTSNVAGNTPLLSFPGMPDSVNDTGAEFGTGNRGISLQTFTAGNNTAQFGPGAAPFSTLSLASGGQAAMGLGTLMLQYTGPGGAFADFAAGGGTGVTVDIVGADTNAANSSSVQVLLDVFGGGQVNLGVMNLNGPSIGGAFSLFFPFGMNDVSMITGVKVVANTTLNDDYEFDNIATDGDIEFEFPNGNVPEPASIVVLGIAGVGGLIVARRRNRRSNARAV